MLISEVISLLEEAKERFGDVRLDAFHHEGGNSLRAYPREFDRDSIVEADTGILTIGGWYN